MELAVETWPGPTATHCMHCALGAFDLLVSLTVYAFTAFLSHKSIPMVVCPSNVVLVLHSSIVICRALPRFSVPLVIHLLLLTAGEFEGPNSQDAAVVCGNWCH